MQAYILDHCHDYVCMMFLTHYEVSQSILHYLAISLFTGYDTFWKNIGIPWILTFTKLFSLDFH